MTGLKHNRSQEDSDIFRIRVGKKVQRQLTRAQLQRAPHSLLSKLLLADESWKGGDSLPSAVLPKISLPGIRCWPHGMDAILQVITFFHRDRLLGFLTPVGPSQDYLSYDRARS